MATRGWDALVVGAGATGTGLLRDLARRGLRTLAIDKGDFVTGTSGRYHGLLHSGARYVVKDASAARECIRENRILRRIAAPAIEDTGGWFVQTGDDPDDYAAGFAAACAASDVDCEEVDPAVLLATQPTLTRSLRRTFRVPDASLEPWKLAEGNIAEARALGSDAWAYHELVGFEREGDRLAAARVRDVRAGTITRVPFEIVVSAAGAWAGRVAAMAGAKLHMSPGKGTMLIFNQRMTDTCINRLHPPSDGDIMVPVGTVAILGTTEILVDDPDDYDITPAEVDELMVEGEKLFPDLRRMRLMRAYAGVRPLYDVAAVGGGDHEGSREISRSHTVIDHAKTDGIANFVSIVGGKLTTYRLMAEQTGDVVAAKLGLTKPSRTAEEPLPFAEPARFHWLGARLAAHESRGGGDADLICECELVTRNDVRRFLDERWPASLDDVRRGTRLGMGPCQGGFCTFRGAGMVAERSVALAGGRPEAATAPAGLGGDDGLAGITDRASTDFLRERHKGTRPVAYGRQLQEWSFVTAIYRGTLGIAALESARAPQPPPLPAAEPVLQPIAGGALAPEAADADR